MFEVTYLGHQGWLVETASARVLIDPLLGPGIGNMPDDGLDVYPPRHVELDAFPPVSAVVITHEHADHLSIPTLLCLDRAIPVHIPARASAAARGLLRGLGFPLGLLVTGAPAVVGDIEIHSFAPGEATLDEWDVRPILVRDRTGHGSLATSIDAVESPDFARFCLARSGPPGVWVSSHNQMDMFAVRQGIAEETSASAEARLTRDFLARFQRHFPRGPRPEVLAVLGSAFTFQDDLAWMNRHVFRGHAAAIARGLEALEGVVVRAPVPGNRLSFAGSKLREEAAARPYLTTLDRALWPPHGDEPHHGEVPDFAPATGRRDFSPDDLTALLGALSGFAGHLYGREPFRALYAAGDDAFAPREATVGFALRTSSETLTVKYRPEACAFEVDASPRAHERLAAGLSCWATDLLAILRFELFAGYMLIGRYRTWNATGGRLPCDLDLDLMLYTHPLRQPDRVLALYRRTVAALSVPVTVRHGPPG